MTDHRFGFRTRALHAGGIPDAVTGARAVPIYQTTSFVFQDTADAAKLFALQKYGNIYSRIGNPTVAALEERLASLEGGIGAVAPAAPQNRWTLPAPMAIVGCMQQDEIWDLDAAQHYDTPGQAGHRSTRSAPSDAASSELTRRARTAVIVWQAAGGGRL